MTLTFGFDKPRDVLDKARRDFGRLTAAADRNSEREIADALFDFAVTIFHVKDWLKLEHSATYAPQDVEAYISSSPALSSFHDLCTAGKHKVITRYSPSTTDVLASATPVVSAVLGGSKGPSSNKLFVAKIIGTDGTRRAAVVEAAQALADWDSFFQLHRL